MKRRRKEEEVEEIEEVEIVYELFSMTSTLLSTFQDKCARSLNKLVNLAERLLRLRQHSRLQSTTGAVDLQIKLEQALLG